MNRACVGNVERDAGRASAAVSAGRRPRRKGGRELATDTARRRVDGSGSGQDKGTGSALRSRLGVYASAQVPCARISQPGRKEGSARSLKESFPPPARTAARPTSEPGQLTPARDDLTPTAPVAQFWTLAKHRAILHAVSLDPAYLARAVVGHTSALRDLGPACPLSRPPQRPLAPSAPC